MKQESNLNHFDGMSSVVTLVDGVVHKKPRLWHRKKRIIHSVKILQERYNLDFFPKIYEINDDGFTYEYVNGMTINQYLKNDGKLYHNDIIKIKIAMDRIFEKLYDVARKEVKFMENKFMWYGDPNPDNIIWDFKNETLRLIDIDSISVSKYIPISYVNVALIQQLEHVYMTNYIEGSDSNKK